MSGFIANLPLSRKLALIGLIAIVLAGVPMGLYLHRVSQQLSSTQSEIDGLAPSRALLEVIRLTQQHRGLSANVLGGKAEIEGKRSAKQSENDKAIAGFDAIVAKSIPDARIRAAWSKVTGQWKSLAASVAAKGINGPQSYAGHTELIALEIELHDRLADHYGLTLDPAAATYFLVISTLQQMPRLSELLGQARARGSLLLARQSATPEEKAFLGGLTDLARVNLRDFDVTIAKAFEAQPAFQAALGAKVAAMSKEVDAVIALARERIVTAEKLDYPSGEYFDGCTRAIDTLFSAVGEADAQLEQALGARLSADRREAFVAVGSALVFGAVALWLSLAIARSIVRPAHAARDALTRIAAGDLTVQVEHGAADEMGQLLNAMHDMRDALTRTVGVVRANADAVATASGEIAQGNMDLSSRTEEQASALEETAASMHQLGSTVAQNADNAKQANQLALRATEVAARGGSVVHQVVETMTGIHESSSRIADIIGVIDGIAFQTNILALNAAVEAARAGEQGRGFAVVASEVRSLAHRSAEAAKEIKTLISDSVDRVGRGTELVGQAGQTMDEVVTSIRRVADLMGEISSASAEQSSSVTQVGEAIQQMDQATQQNAALVEESAAAASSMRDQAQQLVEAVSTFRLDGDSRGRLLLPG